ncbi:MAG: putative HNHc nuclease [Cetobacterium sp.]|uniref:putative HNHc nuclease n=1 Tax=Cetobacterium sp. TaxID=2071632 RepID=UPI003EE572E9
MYRLIIEENKCIVEVSENLSVAELKRLHSKINKGIEIKKVDTITLDQSKMLWAIFRDLGDLIGYTKEELREILENTYCTEKKIEYFSLSPNKKNCASKDIATDFITWVIEWSLNQGYNLIIYEGKGTNKQIRGAREIVPSIKRYVVACLRNKVCAVCGKREADLHHEPPLGIPYELDDGLQTGFIPLCREHHSARHNTSWEDFKNKWHIENIWLNPTMVLELKKVYPGHFKNFKKENYLGGNSEK